MLRALAAACLLVLLLGRSAGVQAQGPARSIIVVTPKNVLTVGEEVQLGALTRDQTGTPRRADSFTWSSINPAVVSVDPNGVATAKGIGFATVAANVGTLRGTVIIQTFPQRVDVLADRYEISVGEELQMAAVARDIRDEVIPNAPFRWEWAGDNGGQTNTARVSQSGVLTAVAAGAVTVRAVIPYTGVPAGLTQNFIAFARVVIRNREDYRLRRLLASDPLPAPVRLRPVFNGLEFSVNDSGQMAFVADFSGLSNALMRYDNGRFELLASAGMPSPVPGALISSFSTPSINSRGEVLANLPASGGGGGMSGNALVVFDKSGAGKPVFFDNQSDGAFQRLNFFNTSRYSLNDSGAILFMANFQIPGSQQFQVGMFKLTGTDLQAMSTTMDRLPGFPPIQSYGYGRFGIDRNGAAYFVAVAGTQSALYKADGQNAPVRIAGTGDNLGGFVVQSINSLGIAPNGNIAFTASSTTFESKAFRFRPTDRAPQMVRSEWVQYGPISINDAGDVVVVGNAEQSWGLHRWSGDTMTMLLTNSPEEGRQVVGATIDNFSDALINSQGQVYTHALTTDNDSVIVRADNRQLLFRSNAAVNVSPNLNFMGFVPGAGSGPPQLLTGGAPQSIHEVVGQNLNPIFIAGDRPTADARGFILSSSTRTPSGTLYYSGYFWGGSVIMRYSNGRSEKVFQAPGTATTSSSSTVNLNWVSGDSNLVASNDGTVVFTGTTSTGQSLLLSYSRGQARVIAFLGGNDATPSPSGGQFERLDWTRSISIDNQGRIVASINVRNGGSGIFLYENGAWRTVSLLQDLRIDGQQVTGVQTLDAASGKIFAAFFTPGFSTVIAEYSNGRWTSVVGRGLTLPTGAEINSVNAPIVFNGNGDLACSVFTTAGTAIIVRTADGNIRVVYVAGQFIETGDLFSPNSLLQFDLRDDRRLYVIATTVYDQRVLYLAEPLF